MKLSPYSPGASDDKESVCNARIIGLIPGSRRSPREGNSNPLQYSCLKIPMDRGTWWATVHRFAKNQAQPEWLIFSLSHSLYLILGSNKFPTPLYTCVITYPIFPSPLYLYISLLLQFRYHNILQSIYHISKNHSVI